MKKSESLEDKLRNSAKKYEDCEGCVFFTYPTARILLDGKQLKTCSQFRYPENCDLKPRLDDD